MKKILFAIICACVVFVEARADVIEHGAERYTINVSQMDLNGEETLMDVLLMCPEAMTLDFKTQIKSGTTPNAFDNFSLRVDNINLNMNAETFLEMTKAKEVEKIVFCTHTGVLKGSDGTDKKIDVYFRKGARGVNGKSTLKADSQGNLSTYHSAKNETDNMLLWGSVVGRLGYVERPGTRTNSGEEDIWAGMDWNISPKDKLIIRAAQYYTYDHMRTSAVRSKKHRQAFNVKYNRSLCNGEGYFMFHLIMVNDINKRIPEGANPNQHEYNLSPNATWEFGFPLFKRKLYVTAGVEANFTRHNDDLQEVINYSDHVDVYAQLDLKLGKWTLSAGDRLRNNNYQQNDHNPYIKDERLKKLAYTHSDIDHNLTLSVFGKVAKNSTIQAIFAKKIWTPQFDDFCGIDEKGDFIYLEDVKIPQAYTAELKYTYQQKDFVLMGMANFLHHTKGCVKANILNVGASTFWHKGIFRLTVGADYYHDCNDPGTGTVIADYFRLRLQPQVTLPQQWRIVPTLIYNSPIYGAREKSSLTGLIASLSVQKNFGKHWNLNAAFNNIASQNYGRRNVSVSAIYMW